jgi:2-amino-4-hydroxy-6-hydroxymethyldihydropteridine diphosphokinase
MVLIGLGSNQGDSTEIVRAAIEEMRVFALESTLRSARLLQTSPVDCPAESGDFINCAVIFEAKAGLTPEGLLAGLKSIERDFGRREKYIRNAPRELDLDLLLFGEELRDSAEFTLPHPRALDRLFVLQPAAELLPNMLWPGTGKTIVQLLEQLKTDEKVQILEEIPPYYYAE